MKSKTSLIKVTKYVRHDWVYGFLNKSGSVATKKYQKRKENTIKRYILAKL
jgi:hypothetical protein